MTPQTAQALAAINRRFYAEHMPDAFHARRNAPWRGFAGIVRALDPQRPQRVLDVACGNGRFGQYLQAHCKGGLDYTGIDVSAALLAHARQALGSAATLQTHDLMSQPDAALPDGPFTCIAAIALLHHIPSAARRVALVRALAERLAPGGVLALTAWRFDGIPRVMCHQVPWAEYNTRAPEPIDLSDLEAGDYLLQWREEKVSVRYCHLVTEDELDALQAASGLAPITRYLADGQHNRYLLLRRA